MPSWRSDAFSLVELMTVMALLSVIILGLMAMFTQTQRAFRTGMSQTDVLESGRVATDLIARELSQITPTYSPSNSFRPAPNFYMALMTDFPLPLPGGNASLVRTNLFHDLFFVTRDNQTWTGIGYFVRTNLLGADAGVGLGPVGALYRFETNATVAEMQQNPNRLLAGYFTGRSRTNYPGVSKILDGVTSFAIRPRDNLGWVVLNNPAWVGDKPSMVTNLNLTWSFKLPPGLQVPLPGQIGLMQFWSNAVPAAVEFELGILEQQAFERYRGIPVFQSKTNYLASQAARVHLFRQMIAVRNVDPAAYQ